MKKKRVIKETGEWDDNDEEMIAWKQDINAAAIRLASLVKGEASPAEGFDKYQGPYAHISDTPKGDVTLWSSEFEGVYNVETYDGWLTGDVESLAKQLKESVEPNQEITMDRIVEEIKKQYIADYERDAKKYFNKKMTTEFPDYWKIESYPEDNYLIIDIPWGDWKHDHAYCDDIVREVADRLGIKVVGGEDEPYEENGSDSYSATHSFDFELEPEETLTESLDYDCNEPNSMDTVRKHLKSGVGGSILVNTYIDGEPASDPPTRDDIGKVEYDLRVWDDGSASFEGYEVEEVDEDEKGQYDNDVKWVASDWHTPDADGFDINFTDEEVDKWARAKVKGELKESDTGYDYWGPKAMNPFEGKAFIQYYGGPGNLQYLKKARNGRWVWKDSSNPGEPYLFNSYEDALKVQKELGGEILSYTRDYLGEGAKHNKKPTKRLVMNQGNVYIFEQSKGSKKSYIVGEDIDKDANTIEKVNKYNNQDEAFTDFFARVGIDPNNELKESFKRATKSKVIKEAKRISYVDLQDNSLTFKILGNEDFDELEISASDNPVDLEDIAEYEGYESAEDIPADKEDELLNKWGDIYYHLYDKEGNEVDAGGKLTDEQDFDPYELAKDCLELAGFMDGSKVKLKLEESAYEDCVEDEDTTPTQIYTTADLDKMEIGIPVAVKMFGSGEPIVKTTLFAGKDKDTYYFYDGDSITGISGFTKKFIDSNKVEVNNGVDVAKALELKKELEADSINESAEDKKEITKLQVEILPELTFRWAEGDQKHVANLFGSAEEHTMDFNDFQDAIYKLDQEVQERDGGYDKVSYIANIRCTETYSDGTTNTEDTTYQGRVDCGDGKYGIEYVRVKDLMKNFIQGESDFKNATIEVTEPKE